MEYKVTKLIEVAKYISRGITPKYTEKLSGICVVNQKCIRDYKLLLENARLHDINKKGITSEKIVKKYDVLINSTGVGTAGRVAQNFENKPFTVDSHVTIVRPDLTKIDPIYFGYALKNKQKYIEGLAEGSTGQTEISRQRIGEEIFIKYPDNIDIQKRISSILLKIDEKIELNNKINDNLYNILNSLFKCWFEDYNSYKKDELVVTEIGNIPKDFKVIELDELISIRGGLAYKALKLSENTQDNILISMGNVELNKIFNFNNLKYYSENVVSKYIANAGDLFICTRDVTQQRNQLGCPGIIPKIFEDRNVIIGTNLYIVDYKKNDKNLSKYLFLLLNSTKYRERIVGSAKGTAILMISKDDVLKFKFAFPKNEQILNKFNKIINPLFDKIENNICENYELKQLRDTLLPKLMNGEIDLDKIEI